MCGICGFTGNDRELLKRMCDIIAHRGPDEDGYYTDPHVSLGHKRLSILGLSTGRQPIFNEDGDIVLVYNGELYNYGDLKESLVKDGHRFYTDTDSEVIVHLYEKYGEDCPKYMSGMFAFAIWDRPKKQLIMARDRLGIKPLYYYQNNDELVFASEIKAILLWGSIERKVNIPALDALLSFKHIPGEQTLFQRIEKLLPGCILVHSAGQTRIRRYWAAEMETGLTGNKDRGEQYYIDGIRNLLSGAVLSHLISDVPLGATLSGGLDSSLVVALMSRYCSKPVKTFSIGFGDDQDELRFAEIVASHFNTDHTEFRHNHADFFDILPSILWHTEEPVTGSLVPTFYLAQRAREHVKVLMIGEGADELFGGYIRFKTLIPPFLPEKIRSWAYLRGLNTFTGREKKALYSPAMSRVIPKDGPGRILHEYFALPGGDRLNKILKFEQDCQLPNHHLLRIDKLTMAFSVEARVPFLDHKLVEFANRIPSMYKLNGLTEKYILKKAASGLLPDAIIRRKKQGMSSPITSWFQRGFKEIALDFLSRENLTKRAYFNHAFLQDMITRSGKRSLFSVPEFKLNTLVMLELWHRIFIDPPTFGAGAFDHAEAGAPLQSASISS